MPRQPGAQITPVGELTKFTDALKAVYDAYGVTVMHQEGTIDIYPKPMLDRNPTFLTIYVASPDKMDDEIKRLNGSKELFDQFIKSKEKEALYKKA